MSSRHRVARRLPFLLLILVTLAAGSWSGCLDTADRAAGDRATAEGPTPDEAARAWAAHLAAPEAAPVPDIAETPQVPPAATTVVAVVDSGVNPFHVSFHRPETRALGSVPIDAVDATTGASARYALVPEVSTLDDPEASAFADAIEPQTLYRLAGTPFFYYSLESIDGALDENGHGTHVASSLLQGDPETYVVVIRAGSTDQDTAAALEWAAEQPWIDLVSVSRGYLFNGAVQRLVALLDDATDADMERIVAATHGVWDAGKLLFVSAGNDPTPAATDPYGGPLSSILVGGYDPYRNGETIVASKGPDLVGHFSVEVARHDATEGAFLNGGTSFATPMAAGVTAHALRATREANGHMGGIRDGALVVAAGPDNEPIDNRHVRAALNATAAYPGLDDPYDPTQTRPPTLDDGDPETAALAALDLAWHASVPVNPAAPWVQMGWGLIGPDQKDALVTALDTGPLNEKSDAARAHMAQQTRLRILIWEGTDAFLDDIVSS